MSMWKNIRSLFIIEEGTEPQEEKTPPKAPSRQEPAPAAGQVPESARGKVTEQFTEVLLRAMSENNIEGFDYLEYKKSLSSLRKMPMDEPTRYQSAFAMAQTMGAQPQRLMILSCLLDAEHNVGEIAELTGIGQPALSQQLAALRRAGLVNTRKEAKLVWGQAGFPLDFRGSDDAFRKSLDALPVPDYSDFPWQAYPLRIVPLMTSRGCGWGA